MYAINVLKSLSNSFSSKFRARVSSLKYVQRYSYATKPVTSLNIKSNVENDVTLFHFENPKFFLKINILSLTLCVFWTYLGIYFVQELKKYSINLDNIRFWGKFFEIQRKYSDTLSLIAVISGWLAFFGTSVYSIRSIRKIILHKGGNYVTIVTYNLPGFNTFKIPLNNMSSLQHRKKALRYIPIKIKGKYLYYLVDVRGQFSNPNLFDFTAGLKRTF